MNRLVIAGLLAISLTAPALSAPREQIYMPPELRAKISAYMVKIKPKVATLKSKVRRGRKLEDGIELLDVPADWGTAVAKYKYVYGGDRVLFIEPGTRKVVDTIRVTP